MKKFLMALALGGASIAAQAAVVDFNSNPDNTYWQTPVFSQGFVFSDFSGEGSLGTASNLDGQSVSNGTVHLMDWTNYLPTVQTTMTALNNALFSLNSFTFTSGYLSGGNRATSLLVQGYDANNVLTDSATFYDYVNYNNTSFSLLTLNGFDNLSKVVFTSAGTNVRVGFDDFHVNEANVPEPASLLLFGIGLAGLGIGKRKKMFSV